MADEPRDALDRELAALFQRDALTADATRPDSTTAFVDGVLLRVRRRQQLRAGVLGSAAIAGALIAWIEISPWLSAVVQQGGNWLALASQAGVAGFGMLAVTLGLGYWLASPDSGHMIRHR